jgi:hypothetical protein
METNVVMGVTQQTTAMASRSPGRANPVGTGGKVRATHDVDKVDLMGMETVNRVLKELKEQEPLSIPEPVGRAIRELAEKFLDQLPAGDSAIN